ncbi:hypothetical protein C1646_761740 [Rhizophagus diaphanus]|nr:hypothetical protein C1646_761740 [Rhizophagus diaphanus] [Rhizophagus sp. MUCL 43196]
MDETIETITPLSNHTLSQLELDHPGHPTRDDYCHNQVIDRLIDFEREEYQATGLGLEQESYQGMAESSEGTTQMLSRSSSSEQMFPSSISSLSSLSSENPNKCESPKPISFSSFLGESLPLCESPKPMSLSSFSSESPKPMSHSSEGRTLVYKSYKSSKRMSWSEHTKSRKSSSGIKTNRCSWDDETDMCLLLYLEQNKGKIEKLDNPHSGVKVELWDGASKWMFAHGYNYTADQCYNRWKNNKRHYTNGILNEKKNPAQYKSVGRILGLKNVGKEREENIIY